MRYTCSVRFYYLHDGSDLVQDIELIVNKDRIVIDGHGDCLIKGIKVQNPKSSKSKNFVRYFILNFYKNWMCFFGKVFNIFIIIRLINIPDTYKAYK